VAAVNALSSQALRALLPERDNISEILGKSIYY
jgi:hypothetical protein